MKGLSKIKERVINTKQRKCAPPQIENKKAEDKKIETKSKDISINNSIKTSKKLTSKSKKKTLKESEDLNIDE